MGSKFYYNIYHVSGFRYVEQRKSHKKLTCACKIKLIMTVALADVMDAAVAVRDRTAVVWLRKQGEPVSYVIRRTKIRRIASLRR